MSDKLTALPIRSEADGADERVQTKIVDYLNPDTQQMSVDTDKNAHVEVHGNKPDNSDVALALSEEGRNNSRGDYNVTTNSKPASVGLIAHAENVTKTEVHQTKRVTAVDSSVNTGVTALHVAVRDEVGNPFTALNPLPVTVVDSEGSEVNDYKEAVDIVNGTEDNHDYTVTALLSLRLQQIEAAAAGKMKMTVQIETGVATGIFTTKWVMFNSTATPNISLWVKEQVTVAAGVKVRVILKNLDNQPQSMYSTISGHEI